MFKQGRILRDTSIGPGLVYIDGQQYRFTLEEHWKGQLAPAVNMPVDCDLDEAGNLRAVFIAAGSAAASPAATPAATPAAPAAAPAAAAPAAPAAAAAEAPAAGAATAANDAADRYGKAALDILQSAGKRIGKEAGIVSIIAFFGFLAGGLLLDSATVTIGGEPIWGGGSSSTSFYSILALINSLPVTSLPFASAGAGLLGLLFFVAALLPLLPYFVPYRLAWLAYLAPGALIAWANYVLYGKLEQQVAIVANTPASTYGDAAANMLQGILNGGAAPQLPSMSAKIDFSLDPGFWVVTLCALWLVIRGLGRLLRPLKAS